MPPLRPERQRILILFADTGGGHRSAAEAIHEALELEYPGRYRVEMADGLKQYAPAPFNRLAQWYPTMVRVPQLWALGFRLSDGRRRARAVNRLVWPYVAGASKRLLAERDPDLVVCVHPVLNGPLLRARSARRPLFVTVVTDLVNAHALWYDAAADLCLVPTAQARERARRCGLLPDRVCAIGLPIGERFRQGRAEPGQLRRELGWPVDRPVVLIVGGGEGMGPVMDVALAVAQCGADLALAIVAGRNEPLRRALQSTAWQVPAFIYGFERRMPEMMRAADLLVTKAGPGTVSEALVCGLPMVLYGRLPGQEEGNVDFVVQNGAGIWAPGPRSTARAVRSLLEQPERMRRAAEQARRIAQPEAARDVAARLNALLAPAEARVLGL
jgi:1,2-diacylglycerol 3-beta-galactosyltransferase